jgi:hypothetical protein
MRAAPKPALKVFGSVRTIDFLRRHRATAQNDTDYQKSQGGTRRATGQLAVALVTGVNLR